MLMPRKVAHRKHHRGRMTGPAKGGTEITFGEYGIQALEPGWITPRQIEAARIAMTRHVKRGRQVWTNPLPDQPATQKPPHTRTPPPNPTPHPPLAPPHPPPPTHHPPPP